VTKTRSHDILKVVELFGFVRLVLLTLTVPCILF